MSSQRIITISQDDNDIRLVVFQGRQIVRWKSEPLGADFAPARTDIEQPASTGDGLPGLLQELGAQRGTFVTDVPLYASLMRHLHLPKARRQYLEQMVSTEVVDSIPFSSDEVDIAWQPAEKTGQEVFAIAVPKELVDEHVRRLKDSGIRPTAVYSRAVALTLVAGVPNAVIVHMSPGQADVVLVQDGAPLAVYLAQFFSPEMGFAAKAEVLAQAVEQVTNYGQTARPRDDVAPLPIVLCGHVPSDKALKETLLPLVSGDLPPFEPPLDYPQDFPVADYAVNLGLALAHRSRPKSWIKPGVLSPGLLSKGGPGSALAINLLPERHLPKPLPVWPMAAIASLLFFGVAALGASSEVQALTAEASALSVQKDNVERQERQFRLRLASAKAAQQKNQAVRQEISALSSSLDGLSREMDTILAQLQAITKGALPGSLQLTNLSPKGNGFTLSGVANRREDVLKYTANLRTRKLFSDARLLRVEASESSGLSGPVQPVRFQIRLFSGE